MIWYFIAVYSGNRLLLNCLIRSGIVGTSFLFRKVSNIQEFLSCRYARIYKDQIDAEMDGDRRYIPLGGGLPAAGAPGVLWIPGYSGGKGGWRPGNALDGGKIVQPQSL